MKITFVMPVVHQNGGCRVVAIYAERLLAMGHDVRVVSRLPEQQNPLRAVVRHVKGQSRRGDPNRTAYFDGLGDRHRQIPWKFPLEAGDVPDADVVIATWWRTAFEVAALPPEKGAKVYFVQHHEVHGHLPWDLSGGSYWLPLKKITIANWLVETMEERYGDTDVVKVENSVDTDQFRAPPRDRNRVPRVGFLYSATHFKGVDVTLRAIEIARRQVPDLSVMAFGATDTVPELPLPEGAEYHKLPEQDVLPSLYASCDAWLFSSRLEGFGLPILEAMACRTPVIATRAGAAADVIEESVNGYIVDVEDYETLAARLIDVVSLSQDDWKAMSTAAYARAQSYTWADAAGAFETALSRIAAAR